MPADRPAPPPDSGGNGSDWRAIFEAACAAQAQNRFDAALQGYTRVLGLYPELPQAWFNQGVIHYQRRCYAQALESFRQAVAIEPRWGEAWFNLAQAHAQLGQAPKAEQAYQRAFELKPDYFEAVYNLGCTGLQKQDYAQAAQWLRRAVTISPDHAHAHHNLGLALRGLNQPQGAEQCFAQALELDPQLLPAWLNLAELRRKQGQVEEAIAAYRQAAQVHPAEAAIFNNLGNLYRDQGRYNQAIECYRHVVTLAPGLAEGHFNLGSVQRLAEAFAPAMASLIEAIRLKPAYADAWNNLALTCKNIGDIERALTCFNRALQIDPELAVARWNRAFVYLLKNDYLSGWADFEWRFRMPQRDSIYPYTIQGARWQGEPIPQATLLVHDEQGLGDTLQMVRFLPLVRQRCNRVILETRIELAKLLRQVPGVDQIIVRSPTAAAAVAFDRYVPLMSLPGLFKATAETIAGHPPYIFADRDKIGQWREKLTGSGPKIGLVWAGRPQHTNDRNRSCHLTDLLPLLTNKEMRFVSLQKGAAAGQRAALPHDVRMIDLGPELDDFTDTAAVLTHLDLLITVDTAIAHLAGAMGRPVWVMIPFIPDWRWGMHGTTTPWYPSMRLFRQTRPRDWSGVAERMRIALGQDNRLNQYIS
jgi:tetratricopeptide (TPR) repeat protein